MSTRGDGRIYRRKGSSRYWIQYSIRGRQYREPGGKTPAAARKKLRQRLREACTERFGGPAAERVTVDQLADALLVHMKNQGKTSVDKVRSHLKPVRTFFAGRPAMDVTTAALERYQRERLDARKATATVNREVHALRNSNWRKRVGIEPKKPPPHQTTQTYPIQTRHGVSAMRETPVYAPADAEEGQNRDSVRVRRWLRVRAAKEANETKEGLDRG